MQSRNALSIGRGSTSVVGWALLSLLLIALPAAGQELPIPELALWEAHMTSYGQTYCNALATPSISLLDSVYYDSQRVFLRIGDYTGNAAWATCAQRAAAVYRDLYVLPNNGQVPGYWNFTTGLRMDAQRTGNAQSKNAAILLSQNAAFASDVPLDWTASADYSREVAYAILSYINTEALGQAPRQRRIDLVNQAYDHMNQWFVDFSWPGPWQQNPPTTARLAPFMVGLTAHALIRDWEQTGDSRLIPALKLAADWMWAHAWIPSAQAMWYESLDTSTGAPDLNLLVAPLYAFLYRQTGDIKYRDEGDQIFAGGVTAAYLGGGKQFDQNYWWSFDYVEWRTDPADTTPPTVAITAPLGGATVSGTVTVTATATDDVRVAGVQFKLDGANLGAEVTAPPYTVSWTTTTATDASHVLTAVARDAAGNLATSTQVSVSVVNSPTDTTSTSNGPVAYWKFDEGTGTTAVDSSGHGNTGTLVNGPAWTAGRYGQALAFDGLTNYVSVPSTTAFNVYPLTVAFWMKTSTSTGVSGIVNKYVAGSFNGYQVFMNDGNLCAWYLKDGSNNVYDGSLCTLSTPGYNDNQWHQVTFVVDASGGRLYVDRVQKASLRWTGTPGATTTTQDLHIGHYPGAASGGFFPGAVDDVRIYNSALSSADITTIYTMTPPVISGTSATNVSFSGATITWSTNVTSDSQVEYGPMAAYGSSTALKSNLVTSHSQALSGLVPSRTYHYRVKSRNVAGVLATSGDGTFTTAAAPLVRNKDTGGFFDAIAKFFSNLF